MIGWLIFLAILVGPVAGVLLTYALTARRTRIETAINEAWIEGVDHGMELGYRIAIAQAANGVDLAELAEHLDEEGRA